MLLFSYVSIMRFTRIFLMYVSTICTKNRHHVSLSEVLKSLARLYFYVSFYVSDFLAS